MAEFHVGEQATAKVTLYDAQGAPTDTFDEISGVRYTCSIPECVSILDEDAEPRDALISFVALTPGNDEALLQVELDGDPGDGLREIVLQSLPFRVVSGPAVGGMLTMELKQVAPPPPT